MLEIPETLFLKVEVHALEGYPSEVCGFLLGVDGEVRRIQEVRRAVNLLADSTNDRYLIDPRDTLRVDRDARRNGFEILGFYHSHPDHRAVPSSYDVERAWPWYSYLILATTSRGMQSARAWRLDGDEMAEESLKLIRRQVVEGV
ncbi:MAG: Mov34/MPN/PAD-1 family protein [Thermoplasmata archaeon]